MCGEAREAAAWYVGAINRIAAEKNKRPLCIVSGGETTVTLGTEYGRGGRNLEFALSAAKQLFSCDKEIVLLSCGTDGIDGTSDAAGAIVDAHSWNDAVSRGFNPQEALERHDAHPLLERMGALVRTGPTGTNVMDMQIAIIL